MNTQKTFFVFILIVIISVIACAQQYDAESDFKASPRDGGKSVEITEYVGSKWTVKIPPKIRGLSVTHIGNRAFSGKDLISVTIPNSVTHIGNNAFSGNQLTSVTIPNSVTSIGYKAFSGNQLTSVTIPNSVTNIEEYAFADCKNITSITIPNSVTNIGKGAFSRCTSLISITIPDSVTSIEAGAFEGCTSLTSVNIPNSVTSIGGWAFSECTSLTRVTIPNSVITIGDNVFYSCTGLAGKFLEVLRPLATLMSNYESVPAQERRDRYDDMLKTTMTAQPTIVRIFTVWKPNALDGMDYRYIGRPSSTATGQYAMTYGRDTGQIIATPNLNVEATMTYVKGSDALMERVQPTLFNVNRQDTYIVIIEVPIKNPRTYEVVGTVGCYADIR